MHIAVLIAGVADTKRPLERPKSGNWKDSVGEQATPFKLSPFDEAALEIALKLRDRDSNANITVVVTDGARDLALMRSVASFRISAVLGLPPPPQHRGDPAWLARHALRAMEQNGKAPDLILMGREHGDLDDGMAAAYLADSWQLPFIGLTLDVHIQEGANGCLSFRRSGIGSDESITLPMPAFASVSNDKSNRLRHPLMKNVMLAKQQSFPLIAPQADETPSMKVTDAEPPAASARGTRECRILQGSLEEQALELAAYLKPGENTAHP